MVRIFVPPSSGPHLPYPESPEPLPANPAIVVVPLTGICLGLLSSTAFRLFRQHPLGPTFLKHTGRCTIGMMSLCGAQQWAQYKFQQKPLLDELGIPMKPWVVLQTSTMPTIDDFAAIGAFGGGFLALSKRFSKFPEPTQPSKVLGAMAIGAFLGTATFVAVYPKRTLDAACILYESTERSTKFRIQAHATEKLKPFFGPTELPITLVQQMAPLSPQPSSGPLATAPAQSELAQQLSSPHPSLPPPGSEPHAVALVNGEVRPWPNTDYYWNPVSRDDGIRKLQDHIKLLQDTRKELALEAEYLWLVIAKKEYTYYTEEDEDKKTMQRKELELLGDIHSKLFQDISGYDWMIADSKKNMLQLKHEKWIPEPRTQEVLKHAPERSLKLIRNHLNNIKEIVKATDQDILPEDAPEGAKDHMEKQYEFLKQNLIATSSLLREFEDYVQEGRDKAREDYLKSMSKD